MRIGIAAASLLFFSLSHAQEPCSRLSVAGLRPGMTPDDVGAVMHVEAETSELNLPDGTHADAEEYPVPGGVVHVEYDGPVNRRETRVALVWQTLPQTYETVMALVKRVGEPSSGRDALVRGLQNMPAVWIDPKCDQVLSYYRRPEYWVQDDIATVVRVERLSKVSGESPASESVVAWRASGAPPPAEAAAVAEAPASPPRAREAQAVSASSGTMPPRRVGYVQPVYPKRAKEQGVTGLVTLRVFVQKNGKVSVARVASVQPRGYGFEEAAIDAAERWRFNPALEHGRPVEGVVDITVQFP
jgi:TonB family protein